MCVTSPTVASTALGVPDLVNSWMINSLSEGHWNMWVLQSWFIKDKTECEWRSSVTDGVVNDICCCCWQIWRSWCHCRCAQGSSDRMDSRRRCKCSRIRTATKSLPPEGFALQAKAFCLYKQSQTISSSILISAYLILFISFTTALSTGLNPTSQWVLQCIFANSNSVLYVC